MRLPSYIKLERYIEDENSEDSTSTADSNESTGSSLGSCGPKSSKIAKIPKRIVKNAAGLRKFSHALEPFNPEG